MRQLSRAGGVCFCSLDGCTVMWSKFLLFHPITCLHSYSHYWRFSWVQILEIFVLLVQVVQLGLVVNNLLSVAIKPLAFGHLTEHKRRPVSLVANIWLCLSRSLVHWPGNFTGLQCSLNLGILNVANLVSRELNGSCKWGSHENWAAARNDFRGKLVVVLGLQAEKFALSFDNLKL